MDPFTMVVAIVAISVGAGVVSNYLKLKANRRGDEATEAEVAAMRADIAKLKDRVRALEQIVTDNERQLSEEIRRLG